MALDPKLLDSLPNSLVDMYGLVEIDILSDMARRISTYDYFIPAALHQMQKLQELGMVQEEIIKRLAALTGQTTAEIVSLLSDASAEAVADDVEYYTRADVYEPSKVNTEALHAQLNAGLLQTEQAFFNITRTTANTASKQFERALDRAWTQINTGGFDYTTAIKNAVKDLAEVGIGSIEYKSGRIDNIEVAVRRAVVTGANQTALKTQEVLADELEIDLVEVTAHGGARPEHAKWQGKVFSRKGRVTIDGVTYEDLAKATRYGHGDGLGGWNCRHTFHPYVPGTSRSWSDKELKALEEKKITYNGEKYTEYEASQIQRKIEREIRKQKRTVAAIEAAGGDASAERKALKEAQKSYTDFSEQTGMKKQSARTQIATAKAEREVRKANKSAGVKTATEKDIEQQREQMPNAQSDVLTNTVNNDNLSSKSDNKHDLTKYKRIENTSELKEWKKSAGQSTKAEYAQINKHEKEDGSNGGYVRSHRAWEFNTEMRQGNASLFDEDDKRTLRTIRTLTKNNKTDRAVILDRYVDSDWLSEYIEEGKFFNRFREDLINEAVEFVNTALIGGEKIEKSIVSASYGNNVLTDRDIHLRLHCDEGTHMFVTNNQRESEVLFHDGLTYEYVAASKEEYKSGLLNSSRHRLVIDVYVKNGGLPK